MLAHSVAWTEEAETHRLRVVEMAAVNRNVRRRRKGGKGPARKSKKMGRTEAEGKRGVWLESRDRMGSARAQLEAGGVDGVTMTAKKTTAKKPASAMTAMATNMSQNTTKLSFWKNVSV